MYTQNLPTRLAAGFLVTFALLSAACSDPASQINAPALLSSSSNDQPAAASNVAVLANAAVTCTDGTIIGDVGTFLATPTGSVTQTSCPITGTVHVGDGVAEQAFNNFLSTYAVLAPEPGDVCTTLTGTLDGVTLSPGAYCFDAAATLTGVLTLNGPSNGIWNFKIGTSGTGALTGTNFSVVMAGGGQASNVTWWVAEAATMTTSAFQGNILAGAAITLTGGTFNGNAWSKADVTITGTAVSGGSVTVIIGSLATITVTPDPVSLPINGTQQYTAVGKDADGNIVSISPTWSVVAGGGAINSTALFTAGTVPGTFANTVRATSGSISGNATVNVTTGSLATIDVTPNPDTMAANATQQFTAVGKDAGGNVVAISPSWSVVANGGNIDNNGLFTAGAVAGTFTNTVQADSGSISGFATVVVIVFAPPPPLVAVLANAAVTCTDGTIIGDVGTFLATPTGSVTQTSCPITGTVHVGDGVAEQAFNNFLSTYAALAPEPGDVCTTLTGTLDGVTLSPGAYCFDAAATLTGVLTLNGPANGNWVFKIGTLGTGALTGTNFSVVMAGGGQASNVTWWVAEAATMTTSAFQGNILAGAAITLTGGTFNGNAWSKADVTITGTAVVTGPNNVITLP